MLAPKNRFIATGWILAIMLLGLLVTPAGSSEPAEVQAQASPGSITFKPDIMPQVSFTYDQDNHWFELAYNQYYMRFRPFAIYNGQIYTQKQIVQFMRSQGAQYVEVIKTVQRALHWGFNITGIPPDIQDNLDYLGFKLTDYNFNLRLIEIDETETENYTFTSFSIPKINLTYDFSDLQELGYTVDIVNKTYLLIGNVKNKENLWIDPITYSAPTMRAIGGTLANPYTFWDLWNASNANGWNVVNNTCNTQFKFYCALAFGDNSNPTYFNDTNKQVVFDRSLSNAATTIYIYGKSIFTLGTLLDKADKKGRDGCVIFDDRPNSNHYFLRCQNDQAQINIYGSHLAGNNSAKHYYMLCDNGTLYDSSVDEPYFYYCDNLDFDNFYMGGGSTYFYIGGDPNTWTTYDITVSGTSWCLFIGATNYAYYFSGWRFIHNTHIARYQTSSNTSVFLRNIDCDLWDWDWTGGTITNLTAYRQYTFNLNVTDADGTPVQDANVRLYYNTTGTETLVFNLDTYANGTIPSQFTTYGRWDLGAVDQTESDMIDYNPYRIEIRHDDYYLYNKTFILDEQVDWELALTPLYQTFSFDLGLNLNILWVMLVIWLVMLILSFLRPSPAIGGMAALTGLILGFSLTTDSTIFGGIMILFNMFIVFKAIFWDSGG